MTSQNPVPRPPSRWLFAAFAYTLAAVALAIGLAIQAPWLGLQLATDGDLVRVESSQGPSASVPAGAALLAVQGGAASAHQAAIQLQAIDLIEEPDVMGTYAQIDGFFQRQQQITAVLAKPQVTLYWNAAGVAGDTLVEPQSRPISALPMLFWFQLVVSVTGCLIACWVWVLRPRDWGARMFGITGLMFPVFAMPAAVYSSRELALPGDLFFTLNALNHWGSIMFGAALGTIFLTHPRPLARPVYMIWFFLAFNLWWLTDVLRIAPNPGVGMQLSVVTEMLLAMAFAAVQWRKSRGDPLHRAALRWFILSMLLGSGLFILLIITTALLGWLPPMPQGYAFGFFLFIYIGIALGLRRYRLFDLDEWAFRMLMWLGGALAVVGVDALLILALDWSAGPALGVSLWICGALYFPARQWLWQRLTQRPGMQLHELMPDVVHIAFQPSRQAQEGAWKDLLRRLYDPLHLEPDPDFTQPHAQIDEGGLMLRVPASGGLGAHSLSYPSRGQRLFSTKDAAFVNALSQLMNEAESSRDAHERGAHDERKRIARDMHDDVGARLLMLIHRAQSPELTDLARAAMNDLRTALNVMDAHAIPLADALADWRAEATARCDAAGVALAWSAPQQSTWELGSRQKSVVERALRESLTNALKHGHPHHVDICVELAAEHLTLWVRNDGAPTSPAQWAEGRGLRGMRHRLDEYGAQLEARTLADGRTEVSLRLPLAPASAPPTATQETA
ncbi:ATP-binding protein [Acidovorax sp.]|uniref:sensor histidine kinase n=1 Tax=Acidovorax sp. TaxID=1872122 RepID=UPI00262CA247|nr:ATP-binding protein [Acidovorax sp.]